MNASYYTPLLGELRTLGVGYARRPARIEVVPSADHGEARWMAPHVMLARGWERQLDQKDGPLFYDEAGTPLTPARYRAWLSEQAVSYVALPDAPLDYSAKGEAKLLRRRPAFVSAGDLDLGALAAVRGTRRRAPGAGARGVDERRHRLVHALRAPPREHDRADPLHPLLGDRRRTRLRERSPGGLDRSADPERRAACASGSTSRWSGSSATAPLHPGGS